MSSSDRRQLCSWGLMALALLVGTKLLLADHQRCLREQAERTRAIPRSERGLVLRLVTASDRPASVGGTTVISAVIANVGDSDATLVLPNQGSLYNWRTPLVGWSALPAGERVAVHHPPSWEPWFVQCSTGMVEPLKQDEVFTLRPGESRVVATRSVEGPIFGRFRVVFYYCNIPSLTYDDFGERAQLLERVKRSTPCFLVSNEVIAPW